MAARSTTVNFINSTRNTALRLIDSGLEHGDWTSQPPNEIGPGERVTWQSESAGFATGTQGFARFWPFSVFSDNVGIPSPAPESETVNVSWDNPFVGSNSYAQSAPPPYAVSREGDGSGDNASIEFSLGGLFGPDTCSAGFVWRDAFPGDQVCVSPQTRDQAAQDNAQGAARREPGGGAFGLDTCRQGFVWREASPSDHVCVPPATRTATANDNTQAAQRVI